MQGLNSGFQFEKPRYKSHDVLQFECSLWWKIYLKKYFQDLLSRLKAVISTNESTRIIKGHVIHNLAYNYKFQLKTAMIMNIILRDFQRS